MGCRGRTGEVTAQHPRGGAAEQLPRDKGRGKRQHRVGTMGRERIGDGGRAADAPTVLRAALPLW